MRDFLVLALVFCSLPFCFFRPYMGILVWSWISYMNPHRLTWGTAYHFPIAQWVAVMTLLGFIFSGDRKRLPMERETILMLLLWALFTITSFFSLTPEYAWLQWQSVSKILLMTFVTMMLFIDKKKLRYLLLTITFSVGFYGVKGAIFAVSTAGKYRVYGPPGTFLGDNNDLALGLLIILPIAFFLARDELNQKLRMILRGVFFLSIAAVVFTYSRGGFVGLTALTLIYLVKTKKKLWASVIILVSVCLTLSFVPGKWFKRMGTVAEYQNYQLEGSIRGRLNAWKFAWNLAVDRPLSGGGFDAFQRDAFEIYAPDPADFHDAHSIYFEMLGEHGFIGLGLFLALLASSVLSMHELKKKYGNVQSLEWIRNYCDLLQMSLFAYIVCGAFLGRAYFDLFYHLVALVVILKAIVREEYLVVSDNEKQDEPAYSGAMIPSGVVASK